jgi:hypothetical protein
VAWPSGCLQAAASRLVSMLGSIALASTPACRCEALHCSEVAVMLVWRRTAGAGR